MINSTPSRLSSVMANNVGVTGDPGLGSLDRARRPLGSDQAADERDLEQPKHDRLNPITGSTVTVVEECSLWI
jgi:hypothetical protein